MAELQNRQDLIAGKLAVAAGFCDQKKIDEAAEAMVEMSEQGTRLALPHVLLKRNAITAMQYRLLNMGLRYELDRDEDMAFARFLVKNKYLAETKVKEVLGEQDPYYREGKTFPRIVNLLEEGNYLPKDQIEKLRKFVGTLGSTLKETAASGMAKAPPAPPVVGVPSTKASTIRQDMLVMDHCRVAVKKNELKASDGAVRKVYTLAVSGQLDAHTFSEFDAFLENLIEKDRVHLIVEMSKLEYISSAGIGVLAGTARKARDANGDVVLAGVPDNVMKVLQLVGFEKLMKITATANEALEHFKTS